MNPCQTGLAVVTECNETTSEHSRDNNDETDLNEITFDGYRQNNFETAVSRQIIGDFDNNLKHDLHAPPLCTIEKQLKIENFPMPSKDQMQKIYELILQSDNSLSSTDLEYRVKNAVNTSISQSSHVNKSKSNIMKDMTTLAGLTKIDFEFPTMSMPITTIGYCFPQYLSVPSNSSTSLIPAIGVISGASNKESFDKTNQCFKGKVEQVIEHAAQTECKAIVHNNTFNAASYTYAQPMEHVVLQCQPKTEILELNSDIETGRIKETEVAQVLIKTEKGCVKTNDSVDTLSKSPSSKMRDVEYTTSLDILVGLLNEIQKITTCQTQITKPTHSSNTNGEHLIEFENILRNSATVLKVPNNSLQKKISITAIEELRQLNSKASFCSFYLTNNSDVDLMDKIHLKDKVVKPLSVDKEVNVELLSRKELINTCTEVPSRFFPTSVNDATDISHSLIGIISEPSTPSMLTYAEHVLHSNASLTSLNKIIELPQNSKNEEETFKETGKMEKITLKTSLNNYSNTDKNKKKIAAICATKNLTPKSTHYQIVESEFDPIMKIKRDILVTMYSVLVFTVFAALSFPEMLYRS